MDGWLLGLCASRRRSQGLRLLVPYSCLFSADVNARTRVNDTALLWAAHRKNFELAQTLLEEGAVSSSISLSLLSFPISLSADGIISTTWFLLSLSLSLSSTMLYFSCSSSLSLSLSTYINPHKMHTQNYTYTFAAPLSGPERGKRSRGLCPFLCHRKQRQGDDRAPHRARRGREPPPSKRNDCDEVREGKRKSKIRESMGQGDGMPEGRGAVERNDSDVRSSLLCANARVIDCAGVCVCACMRTSMCVCCANVCNVSAVCVCVSVCAS